MIGWKPRTFMDAEFPPIDEDISPNVRTFVQQEQERQRIAKEEILERIKEAQEKQMEYYNAQHRHILFRPGDRVWFYWPSFKQNATPLKLSLPWSGPYYVYERLSPVTYRLMRPDGKLLRQVVHVNRLKPCPSTLNRPNEFVTLHTNDSFDVDYEREDVELPGYGPIVDDTPTEVKNKQRILDAPIEDHVTFNDIPTVPNESTLQRYERKFQELIDADETPEVSRRIPIVGNKLAKLQRQRNTTRDDTLTESEDPSPSFYDANRERPPQVMKLAEFDEEFYKPMHKIELFNSLYEAFIDFKNLPNSTPVAPIKKTLNLILSSPNVTDEDRIDYFRRQVAQIKSYMQLIEFLHNCLVHFVEVFRIEIAEEQRK